jgi:hypothetical protein
MSRLTTLNLSLAGLLCAVASTAFAQDAVVSSSVEVVPVEAVPVDAAAPLIPDPLRDRHCLRSTGSRIVAAQNRKADQAGQRCVSANGRAYTREDLDRTGEIDLADALRKLDPSIH